MQGLANTFIDKVAQCWTCPVFDNLFAVISDTAAALYERLSFFSVIIFSVLFCFYVLNVVWTNIKDDMKDPLYQKTLKPVLLKSVMVLSLLSLGLTVPRVISKITFEPVAIVTLEFSKTMLPEDYKIPDNYSAIKLNEDGFFSPELRDTILQILQTSVANFQVFIKLGFAIIDAAFSFPTRIEVWLIIKRLLIVFIGLFLTYNFAKLFIQYSFCFMDIILAMAMFAFFFPLSLVLFIFRGAADLPGWMKNLGKDLGGNQIKQLINAIVSVAATILTYTIILLIIRGYLNGYELNAESIPTITESILKFDLDNPNVTQLTFSGSIVLVFVLNYLKGKLPDITNEIMSTFGLKQEDKLSKEMGNNALELTSLVMNQAKKLTSIVVNKGVQAAKSADASASKGKK
jgi:hypothetical protein